MPWSLVQQQNSHALLPQANFNAGKLSVGHEDYVREL